MGGRTIKGLLTVLVDALIVVAVVLAIRQGIVFSAEIMSQGWARTYAAYSGHLVIPLGITALRTPYHGLFDIDNALTIVVALGLEWVLSGVRDRA